MLRELKHVSQIPGEPYRRWFSSQKLELIIWQDNETIVGFHLCYGTPCQEYALIWQFPNDYSHNWVDPGPMHPGLPKPAPTLIPKKRSSITQVICDFELESSALEPDISAFIHEKLLSFELAGKHCQTG